MANGERVLTLEDRFFSKDTGAEEFKPTSIQQKMPMAQVIPIKQPEPVAPVITTLPPSSVQIISPVPTPKVEPPITPVEQSDDSIRQALILGMPEQSILKQVGAERLDKVKSEMAKKMRERDFYFEKDKVWERFELINARLAKQLKQVESNPLESRNILQMMMENQQKQVEWLDKEGFIGKTVDKSQRTLS